MPLAAEEAAPKAPLLSKLKGAASCQLQACEGQLNNATQHLESAKLWGAMARSYAEEAEHSAEVFETTLSYAMTADRYSQLAEDCMKAVRLSVTAVKSSLQVTGRGNHHHGVFTVSSPDAGQQHLAISLIVPCGT